MRTAAALEHFHQAGNVHHPRSVSEPKIRPFLSMNPSTSRSYLWMPAIFPFLNNRLCLDIRPAH